MKHCDKIEGVWIGEGLTTTINLETGETTKNIIRREFIIQNLFDNAYSIQIIINPEFKKQLIGYVDKSDVLINNGTDTSIFYLEKGKLIHSFTESNTIEKTISTTTFKLDRM